jgi:hypothetical protein
MRNDSGSNVSCRLRAHPLQVLGPDGPLPTDRMSELLTYGSVGGVGATPAPTRQRMGAQKLKDTRLLYIGSLLLSQGPWIDQDGWLVNFQNQAPQTPQSTTKDQIEAIRAKGVAGYFGFEPFSAIS